MRPTDAGMIKQGELTKLGGKKKDKWESRHFELSATGLSWKSGAAARAGKTTMLAAQDIEAVSIWGDIGVHHAFEIITKVKSGKVYKLSAQSDGERDSWMSAIGSVINDFAAVDPTRLVGNPAPPGVGGQRVDTAQLTEGVAGASDLPVDFAPRLAGAAPQSSPVCVCVCVCVCLCVCLSACACACTCAACACVLRGKPAAGSRFGGLRAWS